MHSRIEKKSVQGGKQDFTWPSLYRLLGRGLYLMIAMLFRRFSTAQTELGPRMRNAESHMISATEYCKQQSAAMNLFKKNRGHGTG